MYTTQAILVLRRAMNCGSDPWQWTVEVIHGNEQKTLTWDQNFRNVLRSLGLPQYGNTWVENNMENRKKIMNLQRQEYLALPNKTAML